MIKRQEESASAFVARKTDSLEQLIEERIAQEKADFLRDSPFEEDRAPFYGQLYCKAPGYNMKLTLSDDDTRPKPTTGVYEHEYDRFAYNFGDHVVHVAGEVVKMLEARAVREPRQAVFDAFRTMAESVRATRPKIKTVTPMIAPAIPAFLDVDKTARALFDSDPRVIAHVRKVGDAAPCGRANDWEAAAVNIAAEKIRLKRYYDRAWERGCFLENVPGAESERTWRLESEQRAKTLRSLLCPT